MLRHFYSLERAEEIMLESLTETLKSPFEHTANRMIAADLVHAERSSFEAGESVELMNDIGIELIMARTIAARLKNQRC